MFRRIFKIRKPSLLSHFCDEFLNTRTLLSSTIGRRTLTSFQGVSRNANHLNLFCRQHQTPQSTHQRWFWGLSVAFNQVDEERVRLAGPDRAAAEWILRNGGSIKWKDALNHLEDYNLLPSTKFESYKIEKIDLTAADVIGLGFRHLENLHHVKSIKLHGCRMIMDDALEHLNFVKDTLVWLQISRCPMITDNGLENLHNMKKLKTLVIYDLIELKNFDASISRLSKAMPWCHIDSDDPSETKNDDDDVSK